MDPATPPSADRLHLPTLWRAVGGLVLAALAILALAVATDSEGPLVVVALLAFIIALIAIAIVISAIVGFAKVPAERGYFGASLLGGIVLAAVSGLGSLISAFMATGPIAPWGRPLRIRGKMVHPELRPGDAWAAGAEPQCEDLTPATRQALAILWHHDAQKEHASVPAFSRLAWLLAGLGAPPELLTESHHAGLQEIDHARRCFALAGGYAEAMLTVEPIPEILGAPLGVGSNPLRAVAIESLRDGCLIEDFNADIAREATRSAVDPAAKELVTIIARDEREHAALAWNILEWCIATGGPELRRAIARAADKLPLEGPRAYAEDEASLIAAADPEAMLAHGRVPADRWATIYARRRQLTVTRVQRLLQGADPLPRAA